MILTVTGIAGTALAEPDYWDTRLDQICGLYLEDVSGSVSTGNYYWRLVSAEFQDESESGFNHHIFYKALDAAGDPIEGQKTWGSWWYTDETGWASQDTKGSVDGYWGNFSMWANCPGPPENPCGWPYNAWIDTTSGPSDKVWGMGMTNPSGTGCGAHVNFLLTWQWTQKSGSGTPTIELSTEALNPAATEGSSPANDSFTVRNSGTGTLDYTVSDDVSWLSVSPSSGTSTGETNTVTVSYNTDSLDDGPYSATITVSDPDATNDSQTIDVSLTITASASATIDLSTTALTPDVDEGSDASDDTFTIANSGTGTLSYSITDNVGWLSVSPSSGSSTGETDTLTVTYDTDSLADDTYNGTITVTATGATNTPQTISVTLTVNEVIVFGGLDNGNMEGGSHDDPDGDHKSANDWTRFSLSGSSKAGVPWLGGSAHSANYVQEIYEASWVAGIYQQVGATGGNVYEGSVWVWGSDSNVKFWIGIDPDGGTDASDSGIVWSSQSAPGSTWTEISVDTIAGGSTISLFLKAQNTQAWNLYARLDDAAMTDEGPGTPPDTGTISGTVTDGSNPIVGATVSTDTGGYTTTTDASGDYSLSPVVVGTYDVTATKAGYDDETQTNVSVTKDGTTDVDLTMDEAASTGTISGTITDSGEDGIDGATVSTDTGGYSTTTDSNGDYTLSNVAAGTYDVTASATGYVTEVETDVSVTASQTTTLDITLSDPVTFDGLDNGDMEDDSFNDPDVDHKSPTDWTRFSLSGSSKAGVPWLGSACHSPNYCYEVYEATWVAGIYQQVSGTTASTDYTASVYVKGDTGLDFWIGVDPNGGTSATSGDVEWSSKSTPGGTWTQISKQVEANGSTITVFLKAENTTAYNRYGRFDDAAVTTP